MSLFSRLFHRECKEMGTRRETPPADHGLMPRLAVQTAEQQGEIRRRMEVELEAQRARREQGPRR